jgi:hypothetical protein
VDGPVHVGNLRSEILVVQSAQMTNEDVIDLAAAIIPTERTATVPQPGAREQSSCCGVRAQMPSP